MTLSDQLMELATRTKEFEERAAAAKNKAKADLEQDVNAARESAQARADAFHANTERRKGEVSAWWDDLRESWDRHVKEMRQHVDDRKAAHDLKAAQRAAERADDDAVFAVAYAASAVEEAEYAVLQAYLAHREADDLAESATNG